MLDEPSSLIPSPVLQEPSRIPSLPCLAEKEAEVLAIECAQGHLTYKKQSCFFFKNPNLQIPHSPVFPALPGCLLSLRTWLISEFKGERTETQRGHLAGAPGPRGWPPAVNPSVVSLPSCASRERRCFQPQLGASLTHQARREPAVWGLSAAHSWIRSSH